MMVRSMYRVFYLLFATSFVAFATVCNAQTHVYTDRMDSQGGTIAVDSSIFVAAGGNWKGSDFVNNSVRGVVILGGDPSIPTEWSGELEVDFTYEKFDKDSVSTSHTGSLILTDDENDSESSSRSYFIEDEAYAIDIEIDAIKLDGQSIDTLYKDIYVEVTVEIAQVDDFASVADNSPSLNQEQLLDQDCDGQNDAIEISWSWPPSDPSPVFYELEWIHVNNYSATVGQDLNASNIEYSFRHNSIRVQTAASQYIIPLIYEKGYILYRVRAVGYDMSNQDFLVYGAWSESQEEGTVNQFGDKYEIDDAFEHNKNWQFVTTYSEDGKRKQVIKYLDGSSRERQSLTRIEEDSITLAAEKYYDYHGRPGLQALPTPVYSDGCATGPSITSFEHIDKLNRKGSAEGEEYDRDNFDLDSTDPCVVSTDPMHEQHGNSLYYSGNNPEKDNHQAFVPDAEGYPFSVTEYTPDASGRVRRKGNVGLDFQMGSGHETKFYYGQPNQVQLDRLFGSEVGYASRYQKEIQIDPNGQTNITYKDQFGNVIATSLAGDNPDNPSEDINMEGIPGEQNALETITVDLFNSGDPGTNEPNPEDGSIEFNSQFLVSYAGDYTFEYLMEGDTVDVPCISSEAGVCFNCVYEFQISIIDECGEVVYAYPQDPSSYAMIGRFDDSGSEPQFVFDCSPDEALDHSDSTTVPLQPGNYTISKSLIVSQDAIDYYADQILNELETSCVMTFEEWIDNWETQVDTTDCNLSCQDCVDALNENFEGTDEQYQLLYDECMEPCIEKSSCEVKLEQMLIDMSPNGQYGKLFNSDNELDPEANPLSVFNENSTLSTIYANSSNADWRHPENLDDGSNFYYNEVGEPAYAQLIEDPDGGYTPPVYDEQLVEESPDGGQRTPVQNLANLTDFRQEYWEPSYARSLVVYHPEICYYENCLNFSTVDGCGYNDTLTSEDFDANLRAMERFSQADSNDFIIEVGGEWQLTDWATADEMNDPKYDAFLVCSEFNGFSSQLESRISNYQDGYSMIEVAAASARCGATTGSDCYDFGADYFDSGYPNYEVLNDSVRDLEWSIFKNMYLGVKDELKLEYLHTKAFEGCGSTNHCIGDPSFNELNTGAFSYNTNIFDEDFGWQYDPLYNVNAPCGLNYYELYANKDKRFTAPEEGLPELDDIDYYMYTQTGECPNARNLRLLINRLLDQDDLTTTSGVDIYNYTEMGYLYNSMNYSEADYPMPEYTWEVDMTDPDVVDGTIEHPSTGDDFCVELDISGTSISNWSDIIELANFSAGSFLSGQTNFTATAVVQNGSNPNEYIEITGTACFDISNCDFPQNCSANEFANDLQILMTALAINGNLLEEDFTLTNAYHDQITSHMESVLGSGSSGDFEWTYETNPERFELSNSSTGNFLVIDIDDVNITDESAGDDLSDVHTIAQLQSAGEHLFQAIGKNLQGEEFLELEGSIILDESGNTSQVPTGECADPDPIDCQSNPHAVREDLQALLEEVVPQIDASESVDLLEAFNWTNLLSSYIDPAVTAAIVDHLVQSDGVYDVEQGTFDFGECTLNLINYGDEDGEADFDDITDVGELHTAGDPAFDGSYYDFYFIATFDDGVTVYNDTIFGSSCWPLLDCETCPTVEVDTTGGGAEPIILEGGESPIAQKQGQGSSLAKSAYTLEDTTGVSHPIVQKYNEYLSLIDSANQETAGLGFDQEIDSISLVEFYQKGYFVNARYFQYLNHFDIRWDSIPLASGPGKFIMHNGFGVNVIFQYDRYEKAVNHFNSVVDANEGYVPLVTDSVFIEERLADFSDDYIEFMKSTVDSSYSDTLAGIDENWEGAPSMVQQNAGQKGSSTISSLAKSNPPDPGIEELCDSLYGEYHRAWEYYHGEYDPSVDCPHNDNNNNLYSENTIERLNLCCSLEAVEEFEEWINSFYTVPPCPISPRGSSSCDSTFVDSVNCQFNYVKFLGYVEAYNESDWAIANGIYLNSNPFNSFNEFYNKDFCGCVTDYMDYLLDYIAADGGSSLPEPLSITEYPGCPADDISECEELFYEYHLLVIEYNQFVMTDDPPGSFTYITNFAETYEEFLPLCDCYQEYKAVLETIMDGILPEDISPSQIAKLNGFCTSNPPPPPCSDTLIVPPPPIPVPPTDPCTEYLLGMDSLNAAEAYDVYVDSVINDFAERYTAKCMQAAESFTVGYDDKEYHFTLYYYDQAGNLVRTVPPEGVRPLDINDSSDPLSQDIQEDRENGTHTVLTDHRMPTTYKYNSLDQVTRQTLPDHDRMTKERVVDIQGPRLDLEEITDVDFINESTGYLAGYYNSPSSGQDRGMLYTSTDGGYHWEELQGLMDYDIIEIQMVTADVGYAIAEGPLVLKTASGGQYWDVVDTEDILSSTDQLNDLFFKDVDEGIIVGDNKLLIKTTDGGDTFTNGGIPNAGYLPATYNCLAIYEDPSDNTAYLSLEAEWSVFGLEHGMIFTSTDFGDVWAVHPEFVNPTQSFFGIQAIGGSGVRAHGAKGMQFVQSWSYGTNSYPRQVGCNLSGDIRDMFFYDENYGIAIVENDNGDGKLYYSNDKGYTWSFVSGDQDVYSTDLNSIAPYQHSTSNPEAKAVVVGNDGLALRVWFDSQDAHAVSIDQDFGTDNFEEATAYKTSGKVHVVCTIENSGDLVYISDADSSTPGVSTLSTGASPSQLPFKLIIMKSWTAVNNDVAVDGLILDSNMELITFHKDYSSSSFTFGSITTLSNVRGISTELDGDLAYVYNYSPNRIAEIELDPNSSSTSHSVTVVPNNSLNCPDIHLAKVGGYFFLVGSSGKFRRYKISDGNPYDSRAKCLSVPIYDISKRPTDGEIYFAGKYGEVFQTLNANSLYYRFATDISDHINDIAWYDQGSDYWAYMAGDGGLLAKVDFPLTSFPRYTTTTTLYGLGQSLDYNGIALNGTALFAVGENGVQYYNSNIIDLPSSGGTFYDNGITGDLYAAETIPGTSDHFVAGGFDSELFLKQAGTTVNVTGVYPPVIDAIDFNDSGAGMAVFSNQTLRKTMNGGADWSTVEPDYNTDDYQVRDLHMAEEQTGQNGFAILVGEHSNQSNNFVARVNGNAANRVTSGLPTTYFGQKAIEFTHGNPDKGVSVGTNGRAMTFDLSYTGSSYNLGTSLLSSAGSDDFLGAYMFQNEDIFAVGTNGSVGHYKNGNWVTEGTDLGGTVSDDLHDIHFSDNYTGYIGGDDGRFYRSVDVQWQAGEIINLDWEARDIIDFNDIQTNSDADILNLHLFADKHGLWVGRYTTGVSLPADATSGRIFEEENDRFSTYFWYDRLGRQVLSQNTRQHNMQPQGYSYTRYDALGRVVETGQLLETDTVNYPFVSIFSEEDQDVIDDTYLSDFIENNDREQVTKTFYNWPVTTMGLPQEYEGQNLRNRVAMVSYTDDYTGDDEAYDNAVYYSYDIHGNVSQMMYDVPALSGKDGQYTFVDYEYDLISGNVKRVTYQEDEVDQFIHEYDYDADNRLRTVRTTKDEVLWDTDAKYFYYDHGPLARVELGEELVQGLDYTYTLQGWLKGINSNTLDSLRDPGYDGSFTPMGNPNAIVAHDVYGLSLTYYAGDYKPIDNSRWSTVGDRFEAQTANSDLLASRHNLYNGNIGIMVNAIMDSLHNPQPLGNAYRYDQLNRIVESKSFTNVNTGTNSWNQDQNYSGEYQNTFAYDANGNITKQLRKNAAGADIDSLTYRYETNTNGEPIRNRLYHVQDNVGDGQYDDDIDDMGAFTDGTSVNTQNNYRYNEIGQLAKDVQEEIDTIIWRVDGKIKEIQRTSSSSKKNIKFEYDAMGNRLAKEVYDSNDNWLYTLWYLRDAQGNVLSTYSEWDDDQQSESHYQQIEKVLYGSERIGLRSDTVEVLGAMGGETTGEQNRWHHRYELKNHLGNIMTVITGDKDAIDDTGGPLVDAFRANLLATYDYYPFGAPMDDRKYLSQSYRYGFNGKEKDDEIKNIDGSSYNYGMRMYDARIGRPLSVDPLAREYPELSPYQFFSNNPIWFIDLDGLEGVQYLETMKMKDGTTTIKRIVEVDVFVATSKNVKSIHYKSADLPTIESNLKSEYNKGFKDASGNTVEFRFNVQKFDADATTPAGKAKQLRRDPNNFAKAKNGTNALKGFVLQRGKLKGSTQGSTDPAKPLTTIDNKAFDPSHTQAHETGHIFLNYDPSNNPGTSAEHGKSGGIFKYKVVDPSGKTISPTQGVNQGNVDAVLKSVPELDRKTVEEK